MAARAPKLLNAVLELGFVLAAGILGYVAAPLWSLPLLAAAMIGYWAFNRRAGLGQLKSMGGAKLIGSIVLSAALILGVLGGAYWLGRLAGNQIGTT